METFEGAKENPFVESYQTMYELIQALERTLGGKLKRDETTDVSVSDEETLEVFLWEPEGGGEKRIFVLSSKDNDNKFLQEFETLAEAQQYALRREREYIVS